MQANFPPAFQPNNAVPFVTSPMTTPLFGAVFSGCPIRTDFQQVDVNKFACRLHCPGDLPAPLSAIAEIAIFLLQPLPTPQHGVMCYWQLAASNDPSVSTGFELLGALTPDRPSQIFYTGWGEHEHMVQVSSSGTPVVLTLGLSLEPLQTIDNAQGSNGVIGNNVNGVARQHSRLFVAQKIAADLFKFLQSFDTGTAGPGNMVVPNNIFDRWYKRFENRLQRNPNFFLKSDD